MYAIILQHFPRDLTQCLKLKYIYSAKNENKDINKYYDTTQGTMEILSSIVTLYTMFMSGMEFHDDFYWTFTVMVDTINTRSGCDDYQSQLYDNHIAVLYLYSALDPATINEDEKKRVNKDVNKSSCEEYISCLFILVAYGSSYQGMECALDYQ